MVRDRPERELRSFWSKMLGCTFFPLPLVMVWKKAKYRRVSNPTKYILWVEWWENGVLMHSEEIRPFQMLSGLGRCDEIREYQIIEGIPYPFA